MRYLIILFSIIIFTGCANVNKTYWCGDHPCINKKEKEAYFKKNKTLEVRKIDKKNKKEISNLEKIMEQARKKEKKRIVNEKKLNKKTKLEQKRKIKEQKRLAKQAKIDQKKNLKEQKVLVKKSKNIEKEKLVKKKDVKVKKVIISKSNIGLTEFERIVLKVKERNMSRSYPDINNIPN